MSFPNTYSVAVIEEEMKLLEIIKETKYGEITIKIRNSKPVIVERGIQTIKLEA